MQPNKLFISNKLFSSNKLLRSDTLFRANTQFSSNNVIKDVITLRWPQMSLGGTRFPCVTQLETSVRTLHLFLGSVKSSVGVFSLRQQLTGTHAYAGVR